MFMYGKRAGPVRTRACRFRVGEITGLGSVAFAVPEPTEIISHTPQTLTIDGVEFIFQNAPGSEAPAELTFYLPHVKAFCGAEVTSRNHAQPLHPARRPGA